MTKREGLLVMVILMGACFILGFGGCSPKEEGQVAEKDRTESAPKQGVAEKEVESREVVGSRAREETPPAPSPEEDTEKAPEHAAPAGRITGSGTGMEMGPAEMVIFAGLWKDHTKKGVFFTHEAHTVTHHIQCRECHHIYEEGKNVWEEGRPVDKCDKCHDEPTVKSEMKLPEEDKKRNLKLAFHNNCRACHKKIKKEEPETKAPVTCAKCHSRKVG